MMGLDDVFTCGRHEGDQLADDIEDDPEYIVLMLTLERTEFDAETRDVLSRKRII